MATDSLALKPKLQAVGQSVNQVDRQTDRQTGGTAAEVEPRSGVRYSRPT